MGLLGGALTSIGGLTSTGIHLDHIRGVTILLLSLPALALWAFGQGTALGAKTSLGRAAVETSRR